VFDSAVPGDPERLDQLALDCRMSLDMSLVSKVALGHDRDSQSDYGVLPLNKLDIL